MTPVCLSVRFLYLNITTGRPVVSRYVVCVEEEKLDGWNGGNTSTSLAETFQLGKSSVTWLYDLRGSFGKNNLDLCVFDHGASKEGHDWHADDIPSFLGVPPGVIFQRRIPAKGERVVPASQ